MPNQSSFLPSSTPAGCTSEVSEVQSDPEPKSKSQDKPVAKKKNGGAQQSLTQTESCQSQGIDLTQDSDQENSKAKRKCQRQNQEFDNVRDFFSAPFHRKDDPREIPPSTYSCKWCLKEVRVSATSFSNLRTHRDGSRQIGRISHGCPKRHEAINAGAKLPPTALDEERIKKAGGKAGTITHHFAPVKKFDNVVLNKIVTLWLLRQSIPWNRVEDEYLQAAFHYCQAGASLFKRKWAADSAKMVYLDLQDAMLKRLKDSDSKFNLIHDVWTTKGNRYGFIGASVSFIDNGWNYNVLHLSLKLVACHHKGSLLAKPVINILEKHQLQNKISLSLF
ncbi:uncharacterized protein PGTG_06582 [Puccinia graminis f. sp. tritici CRL 75-36-700-3]|uniref:BED-type domain-containing protein n=1 Tax=Puccinia graminis f. sp. tritici (strain CRL 75-36-700-3 / race SCCL) TaxID=418459 RepID=E3K8P5_PUCGT|nr:uncharacterized protein PGTG_06582 [Puccinia graminis f. sp. tritici CRL 75-36-700-3]EFP80626.2 hypothetical protein PGTG_06582 [Puccinia graminis f. sp. tritici CRL 75-36-700-3]